MMIRKRSRVEEVSPTLSSNFSSSYERWISDLIKIVLIISLALFPSVGNAQIADEEQESAGSANINDSIILGEDSVVLITGAAGFIGSELARALHHTYNVKKLICIDSINTPLTSANANSWDSSSSREQKEENTKVDDLYLLQKDGDALSIFEYKRQRVFHMLQDIGPKVHFYRSDFRPSIPEYFDTGEVPLLETIFQHHNDITHVVHLADAYSETLEEDKQQAVPRIKDDIKSGMIEALLEQLKKSQDERQNAYTSDENTVIPHFVYASSFEVYNHHVAASDSLNPPPFREDKPITSASSLRGATKIMDEILARAYYERYDMTSIGLRFFNVYGPWGTPGTPIFEMAERAIAESNVCILSKKELTDNQWMHQRDYIYIDDAVDAIMTAMQFRTYNEELDEFHRPLVINVGTGKPSTLVDVAKQMEEAFPRDQPDQEVESVLSSETYNKDSIAPTISYASTKRAEYLLGFHPQFTLQEGIIHLLAWHYDRAFPYGQRGSDKNKNDAVKKAGIESCSAFDKECLNGAAVFPCISECSHTIQCTPSIYDDSVYMTLFLTNLCTEVMYTEALGTKVSLLPSAVHSSDFNHASHLNSDKSNHIQKRCNIAFVSEYSVLFQRLKSEKGIDTIHHNDWAKEFSFLAKSKKGNLEDYILTHGFWTIVPVPFDEKHYPNANDAHFIRLLPKLSPGLFFSNQVNYAIYCEPDIVFSDITKLIYEVQQQNKGSRGGGVGLLIPERKKPDYFFANGRPKLVSRNEALQSRTYQMVRVGLRGLLVGGGIQSLIDSSWMVHALAIEDARLYRCDVLNEISQWNVGSDETAIEFIMGLHDLWSRVILIWNKRKPWWGNGYNEPKDELPDEGTWMGLLSSSSEKYFIRIIPSELVGAVQIDK